MTKTGWAWIIILMFFIGGIGGVLLARFGIPWLSNLPGLSWVEKLESTSPVVINHYQEVQLTDGANLVDLARQAAGYTVSIYTPSNPKFLGNGIIVSSDGLILASKTSLGSGTNFTVVLNDGASYPAQVRALDPRSEVAVLTISATNLPFAGFADASTLVASQRLIFLGRSNAAFEHNFALEQVSQTIANQRSLEAVHYSENLENTITTQNRPTADFVGGPIVDFDGKVVGMTNSSGGVIIGEDLNSVVSNYLQNKKIVRPTIGFHYLNLSTEQAKLKDLPQAGVLVVNVDANSPAAKAGIVSNDLIITADNQDLSSNEFEKVLNQHGSNPFLLTVIRNNQKINLTVNLEAK